MSTAPQAPGPQAPYPLGPHPLGHGAVPPADDGPNLRRLFWMSPIILTLIFSAMLGWAAVAPISTAILAPGVLAVESHRKTIQHLYGGTIRRIAVREGDAIVADQLLIELDDTQARATLGALQAQRQSALARLGRLQSELAGLSEIRFPSEFNPAVDDDGTVAQGRQYQTDLFQARREVTASQIAILRAQIAQQHDSIRATEEDLQSTRTQITLIEEEIRAVKEMYDKGLERKPRYLALQRTLADLQGRRGHLIASMAGSRQSIAGLELQIIDLANRQHAEVALDLTTTHKEIQDLTERLIAAEDLVRNSVILAPQAGTIVELKVFTRGGVIRPGDPILDIVPQQDDLLVDARVSTLDIDRLRVGLRAEVRLLSYKATKVPTIGGEVVHVSADRLILPQTGEAFYLAQVRLDPASLARFKEIQLSPGMPAQVAIVIGERTVLNYLVSPIMDNMDRSFREE